MARKKAAKREDGRYVATLTDHGTRKFFYSTISKADAERKKQEYMEAAFEADARREELVHEGVTFAEWRDTWLKSYKANLSANTIAQYTSVSSTISKFLMPNGRTFGETPMRDFLPLHIAQYVISLDGKSKSTVMISKLVLNDIFSTAADNGIIEQSPCRKMPKVNTTYGGHHALSREEINLISNNYELHKNGVLFMFLLYTGCRRGEAFAMRWENIDFENATIKITESHDCKHNVTKGPKSAAGYRELPLLPPLYRALLDDRKESGLVFPMPNGDFFTDSYASTVLDSFLYFLERVKNGVPNPGNGQGFRRDRWEAKHGEWQKVEFNYHDLRDTFCTAFLFDAGVDAKTASVLMGHSSTDITMNIYTKLSTERKNDSVDKMKAFCATLGNCSQNVVRAVF